MNYQELSRILAFQLLKEELRFVRMKELKFY